MVSIFAYIFAFYYSRWLSWRGLILSTYKEQGTISGNTQVGYSNHTVRYIYLVAFHYSEVMIKLHSSTIFYESN